ncbi:zinc-dependent alcohol dehydrogenase family protein [Bosea sp. BK604]|uniref:zinc-dependent alcohol dehydrogenase family protein n=1 Tax=Bosea sp. BK604 TaxID=2512180 RepID=UPI001047F395|nr:zinc-dependent alcohol dehydrogenase family protein [Bosea sp. BK604]TCR63519.1 NADPH:quinone reductase-like Zn-dependent oxidoreductase [Bosea sp. BK604]
MARAARFHRHGGPEVLGIEEIEVPPPGPREIRIHAKALGLNRADALLRAGSYIEQARFPSGLGLEASGIVESIGDGVEDLSTGDAVSLVPPRSMVRWPVHGELITIPAELAVKHPPSLGWEAAAATWMQYLTAYGALIDIARIQRGDFVAITAASSSVGLAAIQIANRIGAFPIAVTRSSRKAQVLREAGAAHVVASAEDDLEAALRAITGPAGVRVVLDAVGGPAFLPLTGAMTQGGILIEYGGLSPEATPFPLYNVLSKSLTLRGYLVHEITGDAARLAVAKSFILDGLGEGSLKPIIARTFPFEEIVAAHRYLESNEQFGKIVLTL